MLDRAALHDPLNGARAPSSAELHFVRGGGRTILAHQRVPYPFHITRPFYLDSERPDIATLYLQSAAGGLYRGDQVTLSINVETNAAAHVTTQASTIVHCTYGQSVTQSTHVHISGGGFAAITPDPLVLFPGAEIHCISDIILAGGASAIFVDGFAQHDPKANGGFFGRYSTDVVVRDVSGKTLLVDRGYLAGEVTAGAASPLGPYGAVGTILLLGERSAACSAKSIEARVAASGCFTGLSALPNSVGMGGRILAPTGGALTRGLEAAFAAAFEAMVGVIPARRRK